MYNVQSTKDHLIGMCTTNGEFSHRRWFCRRIELHTPKGQLFSSIVVLDII